MKTIIVKSLCILGSGLVFMSCNDGKTSTTASTTDTSSTAMSAPAATDNAATTGMDTSKMRSAASNSTGTSMASNEFVTKAADGGMMEVELGKIAQTNGGSAVVKDYGKMLERDHTKANAELKSIAAAEKISIPSTMSEMHAMHVKELSAKTGADFDKAYINMMVDDHVKDIAEFKTAAKENSNNSVKDFAGKTVPTLEGHLAKAKAIKARM